jgi:ubiquinone/menaquinone biosynthesis C-methylase UbiE
LLAHTKTLTNYDDNANHYDQFRRPSPILLNHLENHFTEAGGSILSIGCGTGRMERALSDCCQVVGLDQSKGMLKQAAKRIPFTIQGDMTVMPFANDVFSGAYFMQSLHHVGANLDIHPKEREKSRKSALSEAIRVVRKGRIIVIQRDPTQNQVVWFWKYFPKAIETKLQIQPTIKTVMTWLTEFGLSNVRAKTIMDPMAKGFFDPESPLDPKFRHSFSEFSYLSAEEVHQGIKELKRSIADESVKLDIEQCQKRFNAIGGTVYLIHADVQ